MQARFYVLRWILPAFLFTINPMLAMNSEEQDPDKWRRRGSISQSDESYIEQQRKLEEYYKNQQEEKAATTTKDDYMTAFYKQQEEFDRFRRQYEEEKRKNAELEKRLPRLGKSIVQSPEKIGSDSEGEDETVKLAKRISLTEIGNNAGDKREKDRKPLKESSRTEKPKVEQKLNPNDYDFKKDFFYDDATKFSHEYFNKFNRSEFNLEAFTDKVSKRRASDAEDSRHLLNDPNVWVVTYFAKQTGFYNEIKSKGDSWESRTSQFYHGLMDRGVVEKRHWLALGYPQGNIEKLLGKSRTGVGDTGLNKVAGKWF